MKKASHSFVVELRRRRVVIDPKKIWGPKPRNARSGDTREIAWDRAQALFAPATQRMPN